MKSIVYGVIALLLMVTAFAASGAIFTTNSDGSDQNKNHYDVGESVYISGMNFDPNVTCDVDIIDVGQGNSVVHSTTVNTDGSGAFNAAFVWDSSGADSGEYKVEVTCPDDNKKSDNFQLGDVETEIPEFGVIGAAAALGIAGLFIAMRKRA